MVAIVTAEAVAVRAADPLEVSAAMELAVVAEVHVSAVVVWEEAAMEEAVVCAWAVGPRTATMPAET